MNQEDIEIWCDENLPEIYDEGMFDYEDVSDEVWEALTQLIQESALAFIEDADDREAIADQLVEAARDWFSGHHDTVIESLQAAPADTIAALQNKPQVEQHSAEWYAQRRNRLTASEFAQILDGRRAALLRSKLAPVIPGTAADRPITAPVAISQEDGEMVATSWGHRFEPVVRDIYELEIAGVGTVCDTLGRFTHATIPWLSASPDGVVLQGPLAGRLVEIKSPKTRQPGTFVPSEYYVQMQIQMEVCDLDAVDFLEAQFAQRRAAAMSAADHAACDAATWKGRIQVYGYPESSESWVYRYSRAVEDLDDLDDTPTHATPPDVPLLEDSIWWLTGWFPRTVLRNKIWWETIGWPAAELFWAQVESGRAAGTVTLDLVDDTIEHVSGWIGSS
jgi:hypothetical protein